MNIIFKSKDGLTVYTPNLNGGKTIEEEAKKVVPEGLNYLIVSDSDLPVIGSVQWEFIGAWELNEKSEIIVNMDKAREIKRNTIRLERAPVIAKLDWEFMRAFESGDMIKQKEIATEKQRLRDLTNSPEIKNAKTLEQLKLFKGI